MDLARREAGGGIEITVLGFGMGNLTDSTLEAISNKGDGQCACVDTAAASRDFRLATSVAAFGQWLAKSGHTGKTGKQEILAWSADATGGPDASARAEFPDLVNRAERGSGD